ncbi:Translationally-controlled tumor protein -like protein [Ceratocystis fimbriata CBS 114723]|uniref:Translationally-controlled tumor protein homolog n=1 Tax=Ceratocystis fimbriata CBS 114723 TaxID=1035309 RepID=A0A2C5WX02_9PEZI|nr:Translationally-controlled tumor protein -like protein [Ceratocystis fimbriata CBS 114723]
MLIYNDIISGDEMISDSFDLKEVGNVVYEADCAMITLGAVEVDTGANASAEEAEEALDDGEVKVNNIINIFRLQPIPKFSKKEFIAYLKGYLGAVTKQLTEKLELEQLPEDQIKAQVKGFQDATAAFVKQTLLPNFDKYDFYTGENMDPKGMIALLNYREDGVTPYFTFWKHGLKATKV